MDNWQRAEELFRSADEIRNNKKLNSFYYFAYAWANYQSFIQYGTPIKDIKNICATLETATESDIKEYNVQLVDVREAAAKLNAIISEAKNPELPE